LEVLNNPLLLAIAIVLSVLSSYYCWQAFREKNAAMLLVGIGLGLPTIGMTDWHYWVTGIGVSAGGLWLRRQLG